MCGISGFITEQETSIADAVLSEMGQMLTHRGPDYFDRKIIAVDQKHTIGLGHNLLSIIGSPQDGRQPFETQWGVLIFNGAIYNFQELKTELQNQYTFKTETDTEVLAVGLGLQGISFLKKLRGMYAFAYYDYQSKKLNLARDVFGVKPLYWMKTNKSLVFASEYKAIIPFYSELDMDLSAVKSFLEKRYVPGVSTLFKNIKKAPPGFVLSIDPLTLQIEEINFGQELCQVQPVLKQNLGEALVTAVKRREVASVEVAGLLSGGIDSGFVCDILSRDDSALSTYTLALDDQKMNEAPAAKQVATALGVKNTTIPPVSPTLDQLRKLTYHLDDPYGDPIILSLDNIFSFIQGRQRVIVTGEGSDELFSGYIHHRAIGLFQKCPAFLLSLLRSVLSIIPTSLFLKALPYAGKISPLEMNIALKRLKIFLSQKDLSSFQNIFHLFDQDDFVKPTAPHNSPLANLDQVRHWDFKNWLPNSQLFKLDKISMKSSIEAREPFVDLDLYNLVSILPARKNISFSKDKLLLRKTLTRVSRVPQDVINSRKTSFFQPINDHTASRLILEMKKLIQENINFLQQFIKKEKIEELLHADQNQGVLVSKKIFCLSSLVLWKQEILSLVGRSTKRLD